MSDLDERIRRGMDGLAPPADPAGAFERVSRRRARRRTVRRIQTAALTLSVVVVTSTVTFVLGRTFGSSPEQATEPPPTMEPLPVVADIAFASDRQGDLDIYVADADGSNPRRLTENPEDELSPTWSPDGTRLAFTRGIEEDPNIFVVNADGSGLTQLTDDPADDGDPAWSPEGTSIAFVSTREGSTDLYVMNADGSGQRRLTDGTASDFDPEWSADGTQLFFARDEPDGVEASDIWMMSVGGGGARKVIGGPEAEYQPAASPDGTRIAFVSNRDGTAQIYVANTDGSNVQRITEDATPKSHPSWSPDSQRIVFTAGGEEGNEVFVVNADGSDLRLLTGGHHDVTPSWNPVAEPDTPPSPPGGELPACQPDQFELRVDGDAAGGGLVPVVEVAHRGEPCRLSVEITLRIEDGEGNLLYIEGNPATTTLEGDLPRDHLASGWWWRNWCGDPVEAVYRAEGGGSSASFVQDSGGARCDAPEEPSRLVLLP